MYYIKLKNQTQELKKIIDKQLSLKHDHLSVRLNKGRKR